MVGIPRSTATRAESIPTRRARSVPANKLTPAERTHILRVANSPEFVDLPPSQIYAELLDSGVYLASISTIYRVLAENRQVKERRRLAPHPARATPELIAASPGQVISWDTTKLPGPVKGENFDAYVLIDICSRYIVGCRVHAAESAVIAAEMMIEVFGLHGIPEVVHADRGTAMTSKIVATLLSNLEVTNSHSRPRKSNDNPFSESWFKSLKFAPVFPERFASLADARRFMADFVECYNHTHHHTGIGLNTPADVRHGLAAGKARTARRSSPQPGLRTRNASPPMQSRRSWPCPALPGSTNAPRKVMKTWPLKPPIAVSTLTNSATEALLGNTVTSCGRDPLAIAPT